MEIDQVDHVTIIRKISGEFRSKRVIYSEIGGHVLTPFFGKNRPKKDKEK
jgi:hypothetical protein